LGSSSIEITDTDADTRLKKIVFSGDLGNIPDDILQTNTYIDNSDIIVMESTYGDRMHPMTDPRNVFISEIKTIEKTDGTLLIPAFSLDRTQEILHLLKHLREDHKISEQTPVFLDSPMGIKATEIYLRYPHLFNSHIQTDFQSGSPFDFPGLEVINSHDESEAIHKRIGPKVIIAGSGMMNGGRIGRHAAHYLPIPTTRLLIVGYQAEDTLGRELLTGAKKVTIEQIPVHVNATVNSIQSMSSHADQKLLLAWVKHVKGVKKIFITHGEDTSRRALSQKIKEELDIADIVIPDINQEFAI
jgi:metallo-beta-lactamase family protein